MEWNLIKFSPPTVWDISQPSAQAKIFNRRPVNLTLVVDTFNEPLSNSIDLLNSNELAEKESNKLLST